MRKLYMFLYVLLLLLLCSFARAQSWEGAVQPNEQAELKATSSTIREKLMTLQTESQITNALLEQLQERLTQTSASLKVSESERAELEAQRERLSVSLMSIQKELNGSLNTIITYESMLKHQSKVLLVLIIILVGRILAMTAGFILYAKRFPIPRWLDILL